MDRTGELSIHPSSARWLVPWMRSCLSVMLAVTGLVDNRLDVNHRGAVDRLDRPNGQAVREQLQHSAAMEAQGIRTIG